MNDKDKIIKRLTVDTGIPEQHIRVIVDDIFYAMLNAMKDSYSVEMSGFGRWHYNYNKSKRDLIKLTNSLQSASTERVIERIIGIGNDIINKLKDEDNQLATDFRRLAEQINTPRGAQGTD